MSGIGGILHLNGGSVSQEMVAALSGALSRGNRSTSMCAVESSAAMVYTKFATTAEEEYGCHLAHEPGRLLANLDGYTSDAGGHRPRSRREYGDLEMILRLFEEGREVAENLNGDFAFSIWDSRLRRLTLGRDAFGVRGLFYCFRRECLIWASTIDSLIRGGFASLDLNRQYIAQYLAHEPDPRTTPFRDISAVPPAHHLIVQDGKVKVQRWWKPKLSYRRTISDEESAETFRSLFQNAVRTRLRTNSKVAALLSGGLDSGAVVCTSDVVDPAQRMETISFVFDSSPTSDERTFITEIEQSRAKPGFHISEEEAPILSVLPDPGFVAFPAPLFCFGGRIVEIARALRSLGARTILSGWGGDEALLGAAAWTEVLGDHVLSGEFRRLTAEAGDWAAMTGKPLPSLILGAIRTAVRGNRLSYPSPDRIAWLPAGMRRLAASPAGADWGLFAEVGDRRKWHHADSISYTTLPVAAGYACLPTTLAGFDVRFPFLDRALIEFVLSIPNSQFQRPNQTRSLLRRAMKGTVPDAVRMRLRKTTPATAVMRAFQLQRATVDGLLRQSRMSLFGFVDEAKIQNSIERIRYGWGGGIPEILRALSLEIWLRNLENMRGIQPDANVDRAQDLAITFQNERR